MNSKAHLIKENIERVRERIKRACVRAGRDPEGVRLIAVSKNINPELILIAYECGIRDFGENYAQEMMKKMELLPGDIRWHFIGHLQTNKIKYLVNSAFLIHTAHKLEHLVEIEKRSIARNVVSNILIEVNIGKEATKSGIPPDKVEDLVKSSFDFKHIKVTGLMCIPPAVPPEESRQYFKNLRFIKDCINNKYGETTIKELSMGMSADFEVAIEEGATMVRVGTAIFGERKIGG